MSLNLDVWYLALRLSYLSKIWSKQLDLLILTQWFLGSRIFIVTIYPTFLRIILLEYYVPLDRQSRNVSGIVMYHQAFLYVFLEGLVRSLSASTAKIQFLP